MKGKVGLHYYSLYWSKYINSISEISIPCKFSFERGKYPLAYACNQALVVRVSPLDRMQ